MLVKQLAEQNIQDIGHAFGYYDYGSEKGMGSFFRSQDAVAEYICGYVRCVLAGGFLHTTSERGEGYIAYKLPGQRVSFGSMMPLLKGIFQSMSLGEIFCFAKAMSRGGTSMEDRMKKEKRPCVYVGMVCVREQYQGQGWMRKVMEIAYAEGDRLGIPVVLDTDAWSKCEKYMHLGMELVGTVNLGEYGKLYHLIRYPAKDGMGAPQS